MVHSVVTCVALGVFSCVLALVVLNSLDSGNNQCFVHLTGHSVSISGCVFTKEFIEYAKQLDVLRA